MKFLAQLTLLLSLSLTSQTHASPANCASLPANAAAWWRAENNSRDSVDTHHGTLLNGAGFADGRVGRAFAFDASQQSAVQIPTPAELTNPTAITLEAWVYPTSFPNAAPSVFRKASNDMGAPQFLLAVGDGATPGLPHFNPGVAGAAPTGATPLPLNTWTHLAGSYDQGLRMS